MFSSFMMNAWIVGTIVAVVAGCVGFFVVLRGSSFAARLARFERCDEAFDRETDSARSCGLKMLACRPRGLLRG